MTGTTLRAGLLTAQHELRKRGAGPVLVVLAGPETVDRGETANELNAWMDPRWLETWAWGEASDEELERPGFWRYWRALPPRGLVALYLSGWYGPPLLRNFAEERVAARRMFDRQMRRIAELRAGDGGRRRRHRQDLAPRRQEGAAREAEGVHRRIRFAAGAPAPISGAASVATPTW